MALEKDLTPEQINDVEKLGQIKQNLPPEKWVFLRSLMLAYMNGVESGMMYAQENRATKIS